MDLQYDDQDVGHLLGAWTVAIGFLALSTTRPGYSPVVYPGGDSLLYGGLLGVVGLGAASSRFRHLAVGVPMSVCGGLVVLTVARRLLTDPGLLTGQTLLTAAGVISLGGLFVREGTVIARGRRHRGCDSDPPTRWQWWLAAALLVGGGLAGIP